MKKNIKKVSLVIILVLWMAFIFNMSAKNSTQSSHISGQLTYSVLDIILKDFRQLDIGAKKEIVEGLQFVVRKSAHFTAYAVLGALWFLILEHFNLKQKSVIAISFVLSVLYAIGDEVHQSFTPGRSCELRDILIDSMGTAFGILMIILITSLLRKYRLKKKAIDSKL